MLCDREIQLTKEQLSQVIPLLVGHLRSDNYVCYSYAAITVERILFIKRGPRMLWGVLLFFGVTFLTVLGAGLGRRIFTRWHMTCSLR